MHPCVPAVKLQADALSVSHTQSSCQHSAVCITGDLLENCRQSAEVQQMGRAEAEECLEFVGLALLANPTRTDSQEVILSLQAAHIRTAMVTGDHVHTAIAVARQCSLLPPNRQAALEVCALDICG